jgi:hypothetical protein
MVENMSTPDLQLPTPNASLSPGYGRLGVGSWKLGVNA